MTPCTTIDTRTHDRRRPRRAARASSVGEHAGADRDRRVVQRADPAHAEPRDEDALARPRDRASRRSASSTRQRADDEEQQRRRAASPSSPGSLEPVERDHAAEQQDERELAELLEQLGAVVHAPVDLVVALVAAEAQPAGERREEPVARPAISVDAVEEQHGGEREPAVEHRREELAVAQAHRQRGDQP